MLWKQFASLHSTPHSPYARVQEQVNNTSWLVIVASFNATYVRRPMSASSSTETALRTAAGWIAHRAPGVFAAASYWVTGSLQVDWRSSSYTRTASTSAGPAVRPKTCKEAVHSDFRYKPPPGSTSQLRRTVFNEQVTYRDSEIG